MSKGTPTALVAAPGSHAPGADVWGPFRRCAASVGPSALWVVDARVLRLHPRVGGAIARAQPRALVRVRAGEGAKSFRTLEQLVVAAEGVQRDAVVVAVGGGTIGDLATVAAHLIKRGLRLVQVPTTLLAAADSSLGGKGAVNVGGVKNAAGVFHYAQQTFLCPELWETLAPAQLREGAIEAWKMAVTLAPRHFAAWSRAGVPAVERLVALARTWKRKVCAVDPYERAGARQVLNFGHTFGHLVESLSGYRVRHGEAVGVGMLCALDVGRRMGITSEETAAHVERALRTHAGVRSRGTLAALLRRFPRARVEAVLRADKKGTGGPTLHMVLLEAVGRARTVPVPPAVWRAMLDTWQGGRAR